MVASSYALEKKIEVFVQKKLVPFINESRFTRIVSYDNGTTWIDNWVENQIGLFNSEPAVTNTGDGLETFLVGKGTDNRMFISGFDARLEFKTFGWSAIGAGTFNSKPAICLSGYKRTYIENDANNNAVIKKDINTLRLNVFSKGLDNKIWQAFSINGANDWAMAWNTIGAGTFNSSPSATCSADGKRLYVFSKGMDNRIWWAFSTNGGNSWDMAWSPIGDGIFTSAPASTCSADGKKLYVFAKGSDNKYWWAFSTNGGNSWDMAWSPIGDGVFNSDPCANCSWDGKTIHVFGRGMDNRIWQARTFNIGSTWDIAWRCISLNQFF